MAAPRGLRYLAPVFSFAVFFAAACSSATSPLTPTTPAEVTTASPDSPAAPLPPPAPPPPPLTASYRVTFESTWTRDTHPQDFPDDAHFSGLIGGTHHASASFWSEGALASEGIRNMAERGQKSYLQAEVEQAVAASRAGSVLSGGDLRRSPGTVTLDFEMTQAFPLVTLVTMVAPSPDWFVGVSRLALFEDGAWREDVRVDLYPYDAGTDSGGTFRSADQDTRPRQAIERMRGFPFLNGASVAPLGTFTFRRLR